MLSNSHNRHDYRTQSLWWYLWAPVIPPCLLYNVHNLPDQILSLVQDSFVQDTLLVTMGFYRLCYQLSSQRLLGMWGAWTVGLGQNAINYLVSHWRVYALVQFSWGLFTLVGWDAEYTRANCFKHVGPNFLTSCKAGPSCREQCLLFWYVPVLTSFCF